MLNLRQRLVTFEKDLAELRAQNHKLLQDAPSGRGSSGGGGRAAPSERDVARVKDLEKEVAQVRSKLDFRENEIQKNTRFVPPTSPL